MTDEGPIRVLYLIDYLASPGGTERHLSYLTRKLDRRQFRSYVVPFYFQCTAMSDEIVAAGTRIEYIPVARYYVPKAFIQGIKLARFIRNERIDIVQTFHYKADVYGALVARLAGIRHIVSSKRDAADYKSPFHFGMHKLVRPIIERYIAVSGVVADVVRNKEGITPDKLLTIHNGVDTQDFHVPDAARKADAKRQYQLEPEHFVVGMSAWFRPEKDHALLIDAIADLQRTCADIRLLLIGGGPLLEHYRRLVEQRGIGDIVRFTGPLAEVAPALQALDLACLVPAMNEGFSNSVLEKMATGLPLIVTDVGGNREAVLEGENGFVIPAGSQMELRDRLARCYGDRHLCERLGRASRDRAEQRFSLREMIDRHEQLYRSMIPNVESRLP